MTNYYVTNNPNVIPYHNSTIVIQNDQSTLKGALWAFVAFKTGMATLSLGTATLLTSPLIVTPLAIVPIATGLGTFIGCSLTNSFVQNASYHLGSRNIVVLQKQ